MVWEDGGGDPASYPIAWLCMRLSNEGIRLANVQQYTGRYQELRQELTTTERHRKGGARRRDLFRVRTYVVEKHVERATTARTWCGLPGCAIAFLEVCVTGLRMHLLPASSRHPRPTRSIHEVWQLLRQGLEVVYFDPIFRSPADLSSGISRSLRALTIGLA